MPSLYVREEINKIMFFGKPSPKAPPYDRLDRIEKKLDLIMDHLGLVPPKPDYENEIRELREKLFAWKIKEAIENSKVIDIVKAESQNQKSRK